MVVLILSSLQIDKRQSFDFTAMAVPSIPRKLWQHPDPESTQMGRFRRDLERATGKQFNVSGFDAIYPIQLSGLRRVQLKWKRKKKEHSWSSQMINVD